MCVCMQALRYGTLLLTFRLYTLTALLRQVASEPLILDVATATATKYTCAQVHTAQV